MKLEFTKPFDLGHAQAGAPYSCRDGREATVLKWDGRHPVYPINGVSGPDDYMTCWTVVGQYHAEQRSSPNDLVMLPLGMIDGKPVFVGDELIDPSGATFVPGPTNSGHLAGCRWPAPAKVYPETTMRHEDMFDVYSHELHKRGHDSIQADTHGLAAVANAALRHAIDGCSVIESEDAQKSVQVLQANLAKTEAELNSAVRELMIAGYNYRPQAIDHADRAARDLAIAEAVAYAYQNARYSIAGPEAIDLAAIIATVK